MTGVRPTQCANCAASLAFEPAPLHCPQCGQRVALNPPGWRISAGEIAARYGRSLALLLSRPGQLTLEYIVGRRQRYVPPLRLYLNASLVFFLIVKVLGVSNGAEIRVATSVDLHGRAVTAASDPAAFQAGVAELQACVDHPGSCSQWRTLRSRIALKAIKQSGSPQAFAEHFIGMAPYAVFLLLPLFAALVRLAYRRRGLPYGTHLVFSQHMHAFWFLALTVIAPLPGTIALFGSAALPIYTLWAQQRVYRGRFVWTLARAASIGLCYFVALVLIIQALAIATIIVS